MLVCSLAFLFWYSQIIKFFRRTYCSGRFFYVMEINIAAVLRTSANAALIKLFIISKTHKIARISAININMRA